MIFATVSVDGNGSAVKISDFQRKKIGVYQELIQSNPNPSLKTKKGKEAHIQTDKLFEIGIDQETNTIKSQTHPENQKGKKHSHKLINFSRGIQSVVSPVLSSIVSELTQ